MTAAFAAEGCSRSISADGASSSSSAPQQQRKAIMLKGPSLTSKTYFLPLPDTLDQLISQATSLFSIPPGKVPHITLGTDERAIILRESYDFIRDRELLHFRWSAETPRRNLANRVRWDAPTTPFALNASASPQNENAPASAQQTSPTQKRDLTITTRANTIANRDPNTQFGDGAAARKAHAKRVLEEQRKKREEEHTADTLGAAPVVDEADQEAVVNGDADAAAKSALELASTSATATAEAEVMVVTENQAEETAAMDADLATAEGDASGVDPPSQVESEHVSPSAPELEVQEALLPPAEVTITIESPPRKKHVDNGGLDTPPSSGSRSNSPFLSSDRALTSARQHADAGDEPSSSPMSSPTRDVSSRHRNILSAATSSMPELEVVSVTIEEPETFVQEDQHQDDTPLSEEAVLADPPASAGGAERSDAAEASEAPLELPAPSQNSRVTDSATASLATKADDVELNRIYGYLSNLISQLLSHKSNFAFQRPLSTEFAQFSSRTSSRPAVDLFTIRDNLAARRYGSAHLEGRMAANAVRTEFEDDLNLLYANARRFYGVRSGEAECVEHLEKFSRSFLNEWKRTQGGSPGARVEKKSAGPFGMTLTPGAAGIRTLIFSGNGRRPDHGLKRNTSYEAALPTLTIPGLVKRPAQPARATSEAFERALRAATATPQADRIKPKQQVVAPFATRSVIETDFMARPPPQQQQQQPQEAPAAQTPTSANNKRKLAEVAFASQESSSRSPSPPPSPSPTKQTRQALTLKPTKSTRRARKKAKQAAAAAAAAEEEDQRDFESPASEPAAKRSRTSAAKVQQPAPAKVSPELPLTPTTTAGGRSLRPRKNSTSTTATVTPPMTPPRTGKKITGKKGWVVIPVTEEVEQFGVQSMDVDGFEVTGSRRRSSRQRKPVNLD